MAQNLGAIAPPFTSRKIILAEVYLADAKLIGQIRNRLVRSLSRRSGETSERCEELQLNRQPEPRPGRLGIHKLDVGKKPLWVNCASFDGVQDNPS